MEGALLMKKPIDVAIAELCARVVPGYDGIPPIHAAGTADAERPKGQGKGWEHPLTMMAARGQIEHDLWLAGVRFRSDWELAHCHGERTVSWERLANAVKDARFVGELPDNAARGLDGSHGGPRGKSMFVYREAQPRIADARAVLHRLAQRTGKVGFALLVAVCGKGLGIGEIAASIEDDRNYIGRRFREALDDAREYYNETIDAKERA
jgi:hypothetical protein